MDEKYPRCAHLKTKEPEVYITEEELSELNKEWDVLPLYEKQLRALTYMKKVSLVTNELLRCRWQEYVSEPGRVKKPAILPKDNFHFKNYQTVYDPYVTTSLMKRKHMTAGPGSDIYGELPIPNDRHVRITVAKPKNVKKAK